MRITDKIFPSDLKYQSGSLLQQEYNLSNQISSGLAVNQASDDPATFTQVSTLKANLNQDQQYLNVTATAQTAGQTTYNTVTQLQTIMSKVSELMVEANGSLGSSAYQDMASQMLQYANQIATVLNTQSNGSYVFGGTENAAPLTAVTPAPTNPYTPQFTANAAATTATAQNYTINHSSTIKASFTPATDSNGSSIMVSGSGATDVYTLVANLAQDLNNATAATTDPFANDVNLGSAYSVGSPATGSSYSLAQQAVNAAVSNTSKFVGQSAAILARLTLNTNALNTDASSATVDLTNLTSADTAQDATDLTRVQTAYSAALSSAAKILNMSLLNYIS